MINPEVLKYFWDRVDKTAANGCWHWTAECTNWGYGVFKKKAFHPTALGAHRVAWMLLRGPVPAKMLVCHTCDNRRCVNPDHLFLGTYKDNMVDCVSKNRMNSGEDRPQAKLSHVKAFEIRWLRASGWPYRKLADEYGVAVNAIVSVVRCETWRPEIHD
jgi:hypothetical protein